MSRNGGCSGTRSNGDLFQPCISGKDGEGLPSRGGGEAQFIGAGGAGVLNFSSRMVGAGGDDVEVSAVASIHHVATTRTSDDIDGTVAGDDVVEGITGAIDGGATSEGQIVDIGRKGVGDGRLDSVDSRCYYFGDNVRRIVDDVGVITQPTSHGVSASAAIEDVVG